jgi:hypothetical protein
MTAGKADGWQTMNVLAEFEYSTDAYHNARNPGTGLKYTRNPNLWCAELVDQLTGMTIAKDDCGTGGGAAGTAWRTRYGDIAITPRHTIGCGHAFSHAQGTWANPTASQISTNSPPTRHRFVDKNGDTVDRIQLHQVNAIFPAGGAHAGNANGLSGDDLHVSVLDEDLPDSVHIVPLYIGTNPRYSLSSISGGVNTPQVAISQEWQPESNAEQFGGINWPPYPIGDIPKQHRQMVYVSSAPNMNNKFRYPVWGGDSGTPRLILVKDEMALSGIVSGGGHTNATNVLDEALRKYPNIYFNTWADRVNALIEVADQKAMSLGRLSAPTGYTVKTIVD